MAASTLASCTSPLGRQLLRLELAVVTCRIQGRVVGPYHQQGRRQEGAAGSEVGCLVDRVSVSTR